MTKLWPFFDHESGPTHSTNPRVTYFSTLENGVSESDSNETMCILTWDITVSELSDDVHAGTSENNCDERRCILTWVVIVQVSLIVVTVILTASVSLSLLRCCNAVAKEQNGGQVKSSQLRQHVNAAYFQLKWPQIFEIRRIRNPISPRGTDALSDPQSHWAPKSAEPLFPSRRPRAWASVRPPGDHDRASMPEGNPFERYWGTIDWPGLSASTSARCWNCG